MERAQTKAAGQTATDLDGPTSVCFHASIY